MIHLPATAKCIKWARTAENHLSVKSKKGQHFRAWPWD